MVGPDPARDMTLESITSPEFTYVYDALFCSRRMFFVHVAFAYIMAIAGALCFVTRLHARLLPLHAWCGRLYTLSMLWATATSLMILNHGLPTATIVSFVFVMGGFTIAWVAIVVYRERVAAAAAAAAAERIKEDGGVAGGDLAALIARERAALLARRGFWARFWSLKTLHGVLMFMSWVNVAGRIFASNVSGDFTCHTYPYYKPLNTPKGQYADAPLTRLPTHDPKFSRLPWARTGLVGWGLALCLGPLVAGIAVAAAWSAIAPRVNRRRVSANGGGAAAGPIVADVGGADDRP